MRRGRETTYSIGLVGNNNGLCKLLLGSGCAIAVGKVNGSGNIDFRSSCKSIKIIQLNNSAAARSDLLHNKILF